jgi:hypothetical protein
MKRLAISSRNHTVADANVTYRLEPYCEPGVSITGVAGPVLEYTLRNFDESPWPERIIKRV